MPAQRLHRSVEVAHPDVATALDLAVRHHPRIASLCGGADFPADVEAEGAELDALDDDALSLVAGGHTSAAFDEIMNAASWFLSDWQTEE